MATLTQLEFFVSDNRASTLALTCPLTDLVQLGHYSYCACAHLEPWTWGTWYLIKEFAQLLWCLLPNFTVYNKTSRKTSVPWRINAVNPPDLTFRGCGGAYCTHPESSLLPGKNSNLFGRLHFLMWCCFEWFRASFCPQWGLCSWPTVLWPSRKIVLFYELQSDMYILLCRRESSNKRRVLSSVWILSG